MLPALIPVLGGLLGKVIDGVIPDKNQAAEMKLKAMAIMSTEYAAELNSAAQIITAEANSESWIARNWRPITMLSFVFIIFNNFVLVPYGEAFGFPMPSVMLPPDMFALLKIGLGGYVVGRSAEKGIKLWKAKQA